MSTEKEYLQIEIDGAKRRLEENDGYIAEAKERLEDEKKQNRDILERLNGRTLGLQLSIGAMEKRLKEFEHATVTTKES